VRGRLQDRRILLNISLPLASALLILFVVLRRMIFTPGYIIYRDLFPGQLYYPRVWHPQGSFLALENYKFVTFTGIFLPLRAFGLDVYEKVVYVSAMAIACITLHVAAFRLLGHIRGTSPSLRARHLASALAALTYIANPAAANIFFDFSLFVGYAFAPLTLLIFMEMLEGQRRQGPAIVAVALLWWLSAIKAHWIVFGALLLVSPLVVWSAWHWRRQSWRRLARNMIATVVIVAAYLLFSAYWLIPFVRASEQRFVGSYAPMTFESVAYLSNTPLRNAVRLLGMVHAWPYVRFEPPTPLLALPWTLASWAIPAMVVMAIIWFRRHWQIWTLAMFAFGGIFLAKGVAPPLGSIYTFLVFGDLTPSAFRWLFRIASKWNVFLSLGYSGLVAFALAELTTRIRWHSWRHPWNDRRSATALLALGGYLIALLLFAWPSFTGDFRGALVPVSLPDPLLAANRWLAQQEGDFKVNWMPVTNGRELYWNERPSGALYTSLAPQPSIATYWNRHPVLYYSHAYDALANDRIASFGKLLSGLNTRFVVYHDDIKTTHVHEGIEPVVVLLESGEEELAAQLAKQRDMRLAWQDEFISIYETAEFAAPLFVAQRVFLATGDLTLVTSLSALDSFQSFEDIVIFDASRSAGKLPLAVDGLLLNHDAPDHLVFALLPVERLLVPARETQHGAVTEAWSRLDVYQFDWQFVLRDHGIYHWGFDYGQGMVAHTSEARSSEQPDGPIICPMLKVPVLVPEHATYHLWVRHLRHPRAAELLISLDGQSPVVLSNDDPTTGFIWEDAGAVELTAGDHIIGLQNRDGFTAVNALALISEGEMAALRARTRKLAAQVPNIYLLEVETDFDVSRVEAAQETAALSAGRAVVLNARDTISTTLDLVTSGEYVVAVRGSIPPDAAPLTITLGTTQLYLEPQAINTDSAWLTAGPVYLDEVAIPIYIQAAGNSVVDAFMLYTSSTPSPPDALFQETSPPAEIRYEQVDPTRYHVRVRAERPFVLALAETYDPLWIASGPDLQVSSVPLYGVINGFFMNRTGSYEIDVEYQPQQWARLGTLLTSIAVIGAGPLILLMRQKRWHSLSEKDSHFE
jgi:hypothetical protein